MSGSIDSETEKLIYQAVIECYHALFRLQDAYRSHQIRCPDEVDLAVTICDSMTSIEAVADGLCDSVENKEPMHDDRGMRI